MKTSQNQFVLNHLIDHGYITEVVARNYGVRRLASRINDITSRAAGGGHYLVARDMRIDDAGVKYTYYSLDRPERDLARAQRDAGGLWNSFVDIKEAA